MLWGQAFSIEIPDALSIAQHLLFRVSEINILWSRENTYNSTRYQGKTEEICLTYGQIGLPYFLRILTDVTNEWANKPTKKMSKKPDLRVLKGHTI